MAPDTETTRQMDTIASPGEAARCAKRGTTMVTRRREPETWIGRLASEVYLGALVLGGVSVVAGIVAVLIALAMQVSNWVTMAD
jgi:hypothetical protein